MAVEDGPTTFDHRDWTELYELSRTHDQRVDSPAQLSPAG